MTLEDGRRFTSAKLTPQSVLECPDCKAAVPLEEWVCHEEGIWCDTCNDSHAAAECPRCEHREDHVWADLKVVDRPL